MENGKLIELIIASLPYPDQIRNIDVVSEQTAIRFDWRGNRFRISENRCVEEVKSGMLAGSDIAVVVGHLVKKTEMLRSI